MPSFSRASQMNLLTADPKLQLLFNTVIKSFDCSIIGGIRTLEQQREFVKQGLSKTMNSKHLPGPNGKALAVDVAPWPQAWESKYYRDNLLVFAGYVLAVAHSLNIKIRWGGDWTQNQSRKEEVEGKMLEDLDHFELAE